jgi:hypothetical protein
MFRIARALRPGCGESHAEKLSPATDSLPTLPDTFADQEQAFLIMAEIVAR